MDKVMNKYYNYLLEGDDLTFEELSPLRTDKTSDDTEIVDLFTDRVSSLSHLLTTYLFVLI